MSIFYQKRLKGEIKRMFDTPKLKDFNNLVKKVLLPAPFYHPLMIVIYRSRVAEVAREHGWHPPKSLDSDENFKPEHTLFCRELRFVAIYALFLEIFGHKKCLFG